MNAKKSVDPKSVDCPFCHSKAGEGCRTNVMVEGVKPKRSRQVHKDRIIAAENLAKVQKKHPPKKAPQTSKVDTSKFVTHVAFLVDSSYSMNHLERQTRDVFNRQINNLRDKVRKSGLKTFVSTYTFDTRVKKIQIGVDPANAVSFDRDNYMARGNSTALRDAVRSVISDLSKVKGANDKNTSFLVITLTDGQDNDSSISVQRIAELIREKQGTDRWSFAFLVPRGDAHTVENRVGVPAGNIQEWDQTAKGMDRVEQVTTGGVNSYYEKRAKGQRSTKTFFADLTSVTSTDLKQLDDLNADFFRWTVEEDGRIDDFVNAKYNGDRRVRARMNGGYEPGRGFYQCTKSVLVQEYKEFVIMHKKTGAIYGGDQARQLAGIPANERVRVRPGQFGDFELFIQSGSNNRKLLAGTVVLYRHTQ